MKSGKVIQALVLAIFSTGASAEWVSIQGDVRTQNGTPLCAMVLANGQYVFSCESPGSYGLTVPLDANGQVTLFSFADGFAPYKVTNYPHLLESTVIMSPADSANPLIYVSHDVSCRDSGLFGVTGQVAAQNGAPLCTLILANGEHMFSCDGSIGGFDLTVPADTNGQVTLFSFADGFQPYRTTFNAPDCSGVTTYDLADYWGSWKPGTTWLYTGRDWDGDPADTLVQMVAENQPITFYTGGNSPSQYEKHVNIYKKSHGWMDDDGWFDSYDDWFEYTSYQNDFIGYGGDDSGDSWRVDGDLTELTQPLGIGQSNEITAPLYNNGEYLGQYISRITLLGIEPVNVPAGYFQQSAHLRFYYDVGGGDARIYDEWHAKDVGLVKLQGVSGEGQGDFWELVFFNPTSKITPFEGAGVAQLTGSWVQVNFLADDDYGIWDEDDLTGIGFVATITGTQWTDTDDFGDGCSVTFSYVLDGNRYDKTPIGVSNGCPYRLNEIPHDTGTFEISEDGNTMIQYFDYFEGDDLYAFKWFRQ